MRRAIHLAVLAACVLAACVPGTALAQKKTVDIVNAIGLVDYGHPPDFRVGTWARYHTVGASERGMKNDYTMTVLVGGEERFWGDDGFWLETQTEQVGKSPQAIATLMSYSIFQDSLPLLRMQAYMRKSTQGLDEDGNPIVTVVRRPPATLKSRTPFEAGQTWEVDTLGADTVHAAGRVFDVVKVRIRNASGQTVDTPDSTYNNVIEEIRTVYLSPQVPLTHIVREDIQTTISREAWRAGRSQDKVVRILDVSRGSARLLAFGEGLEAKVVPERFRRSLAAQFPPRASAAPGKRAAPSPRR